MMKQNSQGITLIALVITIIVLLILAGISIATLTGENGVLTKANTAKERSEIEEVKEKAKTDIMGIQAENKSGDITEAQFDEILKKYDKDGKSDKVDEKGEKIIETSKNQIIKASEIYNGTVLSKRVFYINEFEIEYKENMVWDDEAMMVMWNVLAENGYDRIWDIMVNKDGIIYFQADGLGDLLLNGSNVYLGDKIIEGAHYTA